MSQCLLTNLKPEFPNEIYPWVYLSWLRRLPPPLKNQIWNKCLDQCNSQGCLPDGVNPDNFDKSLWESPGRVAQQKKGSPAIPDYEGFWVFGLTVEPAAAHPEEGFIDRRLRDMGQVTDEYGAHVDLFFDSKELLGGYSSWDQIKNYPLQIATEATPNLKSRSVRTKLSKGTSGTLKWGIAAGKGCNDASNTDIIQCILSSPRPASRSQHSIYTNNCQQDIQHSAEGCCLSGFKANPWGPSEKNYSPQKSRIIFQ